MSGAPCSNGKVFFGLHLYLVGKYCENLKVPGALLNVNLAWAITWFVNIWHCMLPYIQSNLYCAHQQTQHHMKF